MTQFYKIKDAKRMQRDKKKEFTYMYPSSSSVKTWAEQIKIMYLLKA